jgi:beta-galactosidase
MTRLLIALLLTTTALAQQVERAAISKTVTLTATPDGTPPLVFQWYRDGAAIPGATAATYVITPFTAEHAGLYHVTVSNEAGSVTSNKVQLVPVKSPTKATVTVSIAVGTVNP